MSIGSGVTSIGDYAFSSCSGLTSVYYTGDIAGWCGIVFGSYYANPLCNAGKLYINNTLLTDLVIPDSVTSIGDYAFYDCSGLTSVTIPDSVTSIGEDAFYRCSGLMSVSIGSGVTSIGWGAFWDCNKLTSVVFENTEGWRVSTSSSFSNYTELSAADLAAPQTAANYITLKYSSYYWKRLL